MRIDVLDIPFDNVDMAEALDAAERLLASPRSKYVVTPNSEMVYEAQFDAELRQTLCAADLIIPDGAGIVIGSKILGTPLKQKVAGIEFAEQLIQKSEEKHYRFYLLGGKPGIAELAAEKLKEKYPDFSPVGIHDGYFKSDDEVLPDILEKKPDILFVCLGFPKQEFFMKNHAGDIPNCLMIGLGGSLDGFAGTVKRAPKWMIRLNLEWFYRLIKEPWRFKRMLRLPKFLWLVIRRRVTQK